MLLTAVQGATRMESMNEAMKTTSLPQLPSPKRPSWRNKMRWDGFLCQDNNTFDAKPTGATPQRRLIGSN